MTYELTRILEDRAYHRIRQNWEKELEELEAWEQLLDDYIPEIAKLDLSQIKRAISYRKEKLRQTDEQLWILLVNLKIINQ